jgi:hypothetical protein
MTLCERWLASDSALPLFLRWVTVGLSLAVYSPTAEPRALPTSVEFAVSTRAPNENSPKVVTAGSRLVAMWAVTGSSVRVDWAESSDEGGSWRIGAKLPLRDPVRHSVRGLPALCSTTSDTVYATVFYIGENFQETLAIYRGQPQGDSLVWSGPTYAVPLGFETSGTPLYDAPDLRWNPNSGTLYLAFARVHYTGSSYESTIQFVRSTDGGATWSAPLPLSTTECNGARMAVGPDGELYVVWHDLRQKKIFGRRSVDDGLSFGETFTCGSIEDNRGAPPPGYNEGQRVYRLAIPSIDVDRTATATRGRVYVCWPERANGIVTSTSRGQPEEEPNGNFATATPVTFGTEGSGVTNSSDLFPNEPVDRDYFAFQGEAGTVVWIEGHVTSTTPRSDNLVGVSYEVLCGEDTLHTVPLAAGVWGDARADSATATLFFTQPAVFTLPRTGTYYIRTLTAGGPYSRFYRFSLVTLLPNPSSVARDSRDIVLVSSSDAGVTWQGKVRVNDDLPLYDNALPAVTVDTSGAVHVAWYGRRDDPTCGFLANTYLSRLGPGGQFGSALRLSSASSTWRRTTQPSNIGDGLALAAGSTSLYCLWTDFRDATTDIYGSRIAIDTPTEARSFLQAERSDLGVQLTWYLSDLDGEDPLVRYRPYRALEGSGQFVPLVPERLPLEQETTRWVDQSARPDSAYRYTLELVRASGNVEWSEIVTVPAEVLPSVLAWEQIAPNPFRGATQAVLFSSRTGDGRVLVYDVRGSRVATLHQGHMPAGRATFSWDGRGVQGHCPAGIYFLHAQLGSKTATARLHQLDTAAR